MEPFETKRSMKIAIITTDGREQQQQYELDQPWFSTPVTALLDGFQAVENHDDIEVHVLSCARKSMRSPDKLGTNIHFHSLLVPKLGWMRTGYQGTIRAVRRKLKEIRPDLVHGQGTERDCAMNAVFSGYPNVLTIHGNIRQVARKLNARPLSFLWLAARLESLALQRTNGVLCLTNYTLDQVRDLTRRTWLVPNPVDAVYYSLQWTPSSSSPGVLCVANIGPYKNQNQLIRSLDSVAATKKFRLTMLGRINRESPYGREFLELVKTRPWCAYEGFKSRQELPAYWQSANMLVLPTLEDNCPMAVLEAMASGVPVAASRIGGIPDLIDPDVDGLLFDPQKPGEIASAVTRLLDDPATAMRISAAGRKRSLEQHHPVVIARRHIEIYRELLADR
jgi:glycosyltransferase involved in cell wall biosynthesis